MSICLSMIVKNESHVIRRCLRSVRPFIDSYSIADTGSTDDTMAVVREELAGLPGVLKSDEWQDFGTNRNLALKRSVGDYVLFIDADETLECDQEALDIPVGYDGYQMRVVQTDSIFWRTILIRNDPRWRWDRKIHEALFFEGELRTVQLENICIRSFNDSHRNKLGNKYEKDLAVLQSEPPTPENVFYIAQSLFGLNRYEEAIQKYEERAAMGGWDQEIYHSLFMAANLRSYLPGSFDSKAAAFFRAFIFRPQRLEALNALCQLLRENLRYAEAYRLSNLEPSPTSDTHFVSPNAAWRLLEEHALAAYYLGKFEEARQYFTRVAGYDLATGDRERTLSNIGFCDAKL